MKILDVLTRYNGDISLAVIYLVGMPGSGKTTLANTIISKIVERVGREKVHYVRTRNIKDVFTHINPEKIYQIFFVDDAMREQSARRSMSKDNVELYVTLPDVRHIAKEKGMREGKIIVIVAAQVPRGVDLIIRNFAKLTIFKSLNMYEEEHRRIIRALDIPEWEIQEWLDGVISEDPEALSTGLVILPSGAWGWLRFTPQNGIKPDVDLYYVTEPEKSEENENISKIETDDIREVIKAEIEKMKRSKKWKIKAVILERVLAGDSHLRISQDMNIPESTVGYWKNQAMGELRRRVGAIYEEIVAEKLRNMGYSEVVRHGGQSEPDITALDPSGIPVAVSVKLYDYARARHTLNKKEFAPELQWAQQNGGKAFLYYTNLAWGETYFVEIPEYGDSVTLKRGKGLV